jgi:hypothetical protein
MPEDAQSSLDARRNAAPGARERAVRVERQHVIRVLQ